MKDTNYAYAVANVRVLENNLLSKPFVEQLADSADYNDVNRILADAGVDGLEDYMVKTWDFLCEIAPDKKALEFLIVKNDFHNLKSIVKGIVAGTDGKQYCIRPCVLDIDYLEEKLVQREFEQLPKWICETAQQSYGLLTSAMDGQLFDMLIDKASLKAVRSFAELTENEFAQRLAEIVVAVANIKVALRIAGTKKGGAFLDNAFCDCAVLDADELKKSVLKGKDAVFEYIQTTKFSTLCNRTTADFERECDNLIIEYLQSAKNISLGPEPLICYYYAREAEWKMLRIISSAKNTGLDTEVIRERMRELYV